MAPPDQRRVHERGVQHEAVDARAAPCCKGGCDGRSQAQSRKIELHDAERAEQLLEGRCQRVNGVAAAERLRPAVAGKVWNDQGAVRRQSAEASAELLGGAEESVA
jgi:hypothetical protein